jgi:F0F1-type ATP synthase beta subunit
MEMNSYALYGKRMGFIRALIKNNEESKATFVFGQMNEPPELACCTFWSYVAEYFVMEQEMDQGKMYLLC